MKANLDALKDDIARQLADQGFIVFHGYCRNPEPRPLAFWDTRASTDFEPFLATARQAGIKLIVFNHLQFMSGMAEDAAERLEDCDMPPEERRGYERRLREMLPYQGFTCLLEISYDFEGRTYIFELQADWYLDFMNMLDEIDSFLPEGEDDGEDDSMHGYYSRN